MLQKPYAVAIETIMRVDLLYNCCNSLLTNQSPELNTLIPQIHIYAVFLFANQYISTKPPHTPPPASSRLSDI